MIKNLIQSNALICDSKKCALEIPAKKLIIFDWDGTLVDSKQQCFEACKAVFDDCKIPLDEETFLEFDSDPNKNILKDYGLENYKSFYNQLFFGLCKKTRIPLKPQVKEVILKLKEENKQIAVATNGPIDYVKDLLDYLGYSPLFDFIAGIDKDIRLKPEPDMLYYILNNLKRDKEDSIFIGDAPRDIECAKNAEIKSVAITNGSFGKEVLINAGPDYIIDDIKELIF